MSEPTEHATPEQLESRWVLLSIAGFLLSGALAAGLISPGLFVRAGGRTMEPATAWPFLAGSLAATALHGLALLAAVRAFARRPPGGSRAATVSMIAVSVTLIGVLVAWQAWWIWSWAK